MVIVFKLVNAAVLLGFRLTLVLHGVFLFYFSLCFLPIVQTNLALDNKGIATWDFDSQLLQVMWLPKLSAKIGSSSVFDIVQTLVAWCRVLQQSPSRSRPVMLQPRPWGKARWFSFLGESKPNILVTSPWFFHLRKNNSILSWWYIWNQKLYCVVFLLSLTADDK